MTLMSIAKGGENSERTLRKIEPGIGLKNASVRATSHEDDIGRLAVVIDKYITALRHHKEVSLGR